MADPRFHTVSSPKTLSEVAALTGSVMGDSADPDYVVKDVASLDKAGEDHISFLDNIKYKGDFAATQAGACIVSEKMVEFAPDGCQLLISKSPYKSYALIAQAFYPQEQKEAFVSPKADVADTATLGDGCTIESGAVIGDGAKLGKGCHVEPNAVIGRNVEIGDHCRIGANATISHTVMADYSRLYPGVRVGQDGFGFAIDPSGHVKVPQLGRVMIGSHVEIGANTCIDRGAGPDTVIGDGVWIDNCVQIGHNVKIGRGSVIVAQAGIAGSTTIEDFVVVAAQAGIAGHLTIGQGTRIAAQSGIMQNLPPGSEVMGSPALPIKQHLRHVAMIKKMTQK